MDRDLEIPFLSDGQPVTMSINESLRVATPNACKPRHSVPSPFRYRVAAIVANRTNPSALWDVTSILHPRLAAEAGSHHCRYHKAKGRRESREVDSRTRVPINPETSVQQAKFCNGSDPQGKILEAIDDSGPPLS